MGRALGINAVVNAVLEAAYGVSPVAGYSRMPFVSTNLGEERPLIEDDQLGNGRESMDPIEDVATNVGDIVVPVDDQAFGMWLSGLLGPPATTANQNGLYTHVWQSGKPVLPSMSIEVGHPNVPAWTMNYGCNVNQMRIAMGRSGLLNATMSIIAQGETLPIAASVAGAPASQGGRRFPQAVGGIYRNDVQLGEIMTAEIGYSNNFETVDAIRSDGRIDGTDAMRATASGSVTARYSDRTVAALAANGEPIALKFKWTRDTSKLEIAVLRVFLPKVKHPVTGPAGIQVTHNWQGSGANLPVMVVTLINSRTSY